MKKDLKVEEQPSGNRVVWPPLTAVKVSYLTAKLKWKAATSTMLRLTGEKPDLYLQWQQLRLVQLVGTVGRVGRGLVLIKLLSQDVPITFTSRRNRLLATVSSF